MTLKVAFIGNCQVSGLRVAAMRLLPDAEILAFHLSHAADPQSVRDELEHCDAVVTGVRGGADNARLFGRRALTRPGRKAVYLPPFMYPGLHPDALRLTYQKIPVESPLFCYHSSIAVSAFLLGLSAEHTKRLYNAHVFARLGYLEAPAASRAAAIQLFAEKGYDLAPTMARLSSGGAPFMHVGNHPAIAMLSALATLAFVRLGLIDKRTTPPEDLEDPLGQTYTLPVYPAIARRAGVAPREMFLRSVKAGAEDRVMSLSAYVDESFAIYRSLNDAVLRQARVLETASLLEAALSESHYPVPARSIVSPSIM